MNLQEFVHNSNVYPCLITRKRLNMLFVFKVSFGNFAPYMIANEASLVAVNDELPSPVAMERFRPTVVVTGLGGFEEVCSNPLYLKGFLCYE